MSEASRSKPRRRRRRRATHPHCCYNANAPAVGRGALTGSCSDCEKKKLLGNRLQTKLRVNEPGDEYEQEADRARRSSFGIADKSCRPRRANANPAIHRTSDRADGFGTRKCGPRSLPAPAGPLEPALRKDMERRFGHDFSRVRIHSGPAPSSRRAT